MTSEQVRSQLRSLVRAVERLAEPAASQVAYLRDLRTYPSADELALEFDAMRGFVPELSESGLVTRSAVAMLDAIDEKLAEMSGGENEGLWHADALESSADWKIVRTLSRDALVQLKIP
ncbi:hypothetical protein [Amycolatopsis circi]|uniref:hypothetical protein n=1 Tax=Amycolatopsis circi TaxID=871959 RepID=UPI000E25F7AF|nr:hypothetical protein [Amycolatopsis circi]